MKYPYECKECGTTMTIDKPMAESSRVEVCVVCGTELKRVYKVGAIKTGDGVK